MKFTLEIANLGTSEIKALLIAFTCEASVSVNNILIAFPRGQPSTTCAFIISPPNQTLRPRRPPFFLVPSCAIGVTSSILVIVIPARVSARIAA